jgi:hypothetical protein
MRDLPPISYRSALKLRPEDGVPLAQDTIVTFHFGGGTIELRHKGTYLEVHSNVRNGFHHLMVEPRVSNEIWVRIVPDTDTPHP